MFHKVLLKGPIMKTLFVEDPFTAKDNNASELSKRARVHVLEFVLPPPVLRTDHLDPSASVVNTDYV